MSAHIFSDAPLEAAVRRAVLEQAGRKLIAGLLTVGLGLIFLVSSMTLYHFGIDYEAAGGSFIGKLHPGSWLLFAAFVLKLLGSGNPIGELDRILGRQPGTFLFLIAWTVLLVQAVLVQKLPFTPLIDTFLMPVVLVTLLRDASAPLKADLAIMLHLLFAANAVLAIFEYATGFRLVPFVAGTFVVEHDWRSTALFGHPLLNAMLAGCYIIALVMGGGQDLPKPMRAFAMALQLVAMVAFGGRSAFVLLAPFLVYGLVRQALPVLRGTRRLNVGALGPGVLLVPLLLAVVVLALEQGLLDSFLMRFINDNGSAEARLILLNMFSVIPVSDLLLGPDQNYVHILEVKGGIVYGLESLWLGFFITYGILVSLVFFTGLFAFCADLLAFTQRGAIAVLLFFFIVASTSVSLGAKTVEFGMVCALVMIFLRPAHKASTRLPYTGVGISTGS